MLDEVWKRIIDCEGEKFKQIRGGEFFYKVNGNRLELSRTNQFIFKSTIKEALIHVPLKNTVSLQNLRAPSNLFSILMDSRIRRDNW